MPAVDTRPLWRTLADEEACRARALATARPEVVGLRYAAAAAETAAHHAAVWVDPEAVEGAARSALRWHRLARCAAIGNK